MAEFLVFQLAVTGFLARPHRSVGNFLKLGALVVYKVLYPVADLRSVLGIIHIAKTDKDGMIVSARAEWVVSCSNSKCNIIDSRNPMGTRCTFGNVDTEIPLTVYLGMILRRLPLCVAIAVNDRLIPWGDGKGLTLFCAVRVAFILCPSGRWGCVGCEQCTICTRVGCRYSQSGIAHHR